MPRHRKLLLRTRLAAIIAAGTRLPARKNLPKRYSEDSMARAAEGATAIYHSATITIVYLVRDAEGQPRKSDAPRVAGSPNYTAALFSIHEAGQRGRRLPRAFITVNHDASSAYHNRDNA